uniref:Uncharacterized protein n=1 Tax=Anguilla anguilla TaxID=7936 RepID=A0A0E9Q3A2_ANGAN
MPRSLVHAPPRLILRLRGPPVYKHQLISRSNGSCVLRDVYSVAYYSCLLRLWLQPTQHVLLDWMFLHRSHSGIWPIHALEWLKEGWRKDVSL